MNFILARKPRHQRTTAKADIKGTVASSEASAQRLRKHGIDVLELNSTGTIAVYVDGADEANDRLELIKGGGAALTREKIVAAASKEFVCIADGSKLVITGVVTNGLFACRPADVLLLGTAEGVKTLKA